MRMEKIQLIIMGSSLFLNFASMCTICYAFYKFINKPKEEVVDRVTKLEVKVEEHEDALKHGNDRFRDQANTNEMIFSVLLAFVDFEIAYCHHTGYEHDSDLLRAKNKLETYLSKGHSLE